MLLLLSCDRLAGLHNALQGPPLQEVYLLAIQLPARICAFVIVTFSILFCSRGSDYCSSPLLCRSF